MLNLRKYSTLVLLQSVKLPKALTFLTASQRKDSLTIWLNETLPTRFLVSYGCGIDFKEEVQCVISQPSATLLLSLHQPTAIATLPQILYIL